MANPLKTAIGRIGTGLRYALGLTNLFDSTSNRFYKPRPIADRDFKDMLSNNEWRDLMLTGRYIYNNFPVVAGAIKQIANYTIGARWNPQYEGDDRKWGKDAEAFLKEWSKIADVRGQPYSLTRDLWLAVVSLCRCGDFFIHKTRASNSFPQLQFLEGHRIGNRNWSNGVVPAGERYSGRSFRNGIAYNNFSRPIAYRFIADRIEDDRWIAVEDLIHVYDPMFFSQGRGVPAIATAILDWLDVKEVRENEKIAQRIYSSIAILEKNQSGKPNTWESRFSADAEIQADDDSERISEPRVELISKGMIRYLVIGGEEIEIPKTDRPTTNQREFQESIMRGAFMGLGWSYEQAYDSKAQGGANVRRDIGKNQKSIDNMQGILRPPYLGCITYALAVAARPDLELIPELPVDWFKFRPQLPAKISVDAGRDSKAISDGLRNGSMAMVDVLAEQGEDPEDHLRKIARYEKLKVTVAQEEGIDDLTIFGSNDPNPAQEEKAVIQKEEE